MLSYFWNEHSAHFTRANKFHILGMFEHTFHHVHFLPHRVLFIYIRIYTHTLYIMHAKHVQCLAIIIITQFHI